MPKGLLRRVTGRNVDQRMMSEDLSDPESRIVFGAGDRIEVRYRPNNLRAHHRLIRAATRMLKRAGYPVDLTERVGIETNSDRCGTVKFGRAPQNSVLDPFCRSHDVADLFVVDGSSFPPSAAVNPGLTIAVQALRAADHIPGRGPAAADRTPAANGETNP